ncbi:hypothetical protein [Gloeobacter kilaueensis]|uniref:Uncharacterized protein n=1 Tax=Gloeobacter kilaueensis (strain ATCC BAA-2537 / CCAP 1431/1 / ULC 316 / JS1) TaxID=1183438 RepID=U5QMF3_GLOK1|nr:hypothetical protein [Gloeobacter kilaueensis]AGY58789.1 hypothetical protein GKIL_2543 [Gloeobacter kilaueensis JS1]
MEGAQGIPEQGLCGLKLEGFVAVALRLVERGVFQADATGWQVWTAPPFRIEKQGEHLKVWSGQKLVLEKDGDQLPVNQLLPRDLFEITRLEARLNRQKQP